MKLTPVGGQIDLWINPQFVVSIQDHGTYTSIAMTDGKVHNDTRTGEIVYAAWLSAVQGRLQR